MLAGAIVALLLQRVWSRRSAAAAANTANGGEISAPRSVSLASTEVPAAASTPIAAEPQHERTAAVDTAEPAAVEKPPIAAAAAPTTTTATTTTTPPTVTDAELELESPPCDEPLPAPTREPVSGLQVARSLADELATLVSGIEGRSHHLIDCATDPYQLPLAAEGLQTAVRDLHMLHAKLVAFGRARPAEPGITQVEELLAGLGETLQRLQLGLELRRESATHVPPIAAGPGAVHDALFFLCGAMLRAERGAGNLAITLEQCFADDEPKVQIELALEWCTEALPPKAPLPTDPAFRVDLEAADHLIRSHGGEWSIQHLPGRSVAAVVRWPLARTPIEGAAPLDAAPHDAAADDEAITAAPTHRYGGALVLESDPAVRALLSRELRATGRAVFACADGAAARSFLEATPDRFELLIVDHQQRLDGGDALARTIRAVAPQLTIFVLTAEPHGQSQDWPQLRHLRKPFGVHELRAALASIAAVG